MTTTFMGSPQLFFTSESVTEGHPDKICDQISDGVLDAVLAQDPYGRVACETAITTGLIVIIGEISTSATIDPNAIARRTVGDIGYDRAKYGFDADTAGIVVSLNKQSPDIAQGVDRALESGASEDAFNVTGAGDQGMMIGFACDETDEYMPLPIAIAHAISRRLSAVRRSGILPYLRPDGKAQVTVEYHFGQPYRVATALVSTQHADDVSHEQIEQDVVEQVIKPVIMSFSPDLLDSSTQFLVNPTGRFVIGGPMGDAGLTGRKIIVDTYGGMARHGGGAFSGKDPTKVDRSAAYYARYVAKNLVAAGIASRLEIQVSYAIGKAQPLSVMVETFGTSDYSDAQIVSLIERVFDFRPAAIIENLDLRRPIYQATASFGHFGRSDIDLPWERLDKVETLKSLSTELQQAAI
jgi:S-adenosylmethionine synthetase